MRSRLPSTERPRRPAAGQRGFTLIELMIGVLIGLLASLAVTQVLVNFESAKRTTSSGSDAQVNGALALDMLQRAIQPAGYGMAANPGAIGCTMVATYSGAAVANFPTLLAPIVITDGASSAPDTISVFSSGKRTFSLPLRVVSPGAAANNPPSFPLQSSLGVEGPVTDSGGTQISSGDLLVAALDGAANCNLFQATAVAGNTVTRGASGWNPNIAMSNTYGDGSYLVNLGAPQHRIFTVDTANGALEQNTLSLDADDGQPTYSGATEMFAGIVNVQAQYGRDTDGNGAVETWDNTTPATNAAWRQVLAVRLAVVARSSQYEREVVTRECPMWDAAGVRLRIPASPSACATYVAGNTLDEEWMHYRYKVFETVVPLRNLLWSS